MKEIDREREFYESARPENIKKFIENGINDQAEALARSGIIPGLSFITLESKDVADDAAIGRVLSKVEVDDPHYKSIDLKTPEGFMDGVIVAAAKIEAGKKEPINSEVRSRLDNAKNKIIDAAVKMANKMPRRNFLKLAGTLAGGLIVLEACSPVSIGPVVPIEGDTPTPAMVTPTETASPTPTPDPINAELTSEEIKLVENADPINFPRVVTEGSKPDEIGIPAGAKLTVIDGALVYAVINPVGEKVAVGQLDANSNLEKADSILFKLASTPEDNVNFELPWDFVLRGGPSQIAKLDCEPLSDDVITSRDVVIEPPTFRIQEGKLSLISDANSKVLHWQEENPGKVFHLPEDAISIYENSPEKVPNNVCGYFTTTYMDKTHAGRVYEWKNPDGSYRDLTYVYTAQEKGINPDVAYWTYGTYTPPPPPDYDPTHILNALAVDEKVLALFQEWADTDTIPAALEKHAIYGISVFVY